MASGESGLSVMLAIVAASLFLAAVAIGPEAAPDPLEYTARMMWEAGQNERLRLSHPNPPPIPVANAHEYCDTPRIAASPGMSSAASARPRVESVPVGWMQQWPGGR